MQPKKNYHRRRKKPRKRAAMNELKTSYGLISLKFTAGNFQVFLRLTAFCNFYARQTSTTRKLSFPSSSRTTPPLSSNFSFRTERFVIILRIYFFFWLKNIFRVFRIPHNNINHITKIEFVQFNDKEDELTHLSFFKKTPQQWQDNLK